MSIKDQVRLGVSLPHRAATAIPVEAVRHVATRAEELGFDDLWVTDNFIDRNHCYDALVAMTYATGITTSIRVGVAVLVLPVRHPALLAHQIATVDVLSGGRLTVGVAIGREGHYQSLGLASDRKLRRFNECLAVIRALWSDPSVTYAGATQHIEDVRMGLKPVQRPGPPLWFGGTSVPAVQRAAAQGDGWVGSGRQALASFRATVPALREAVEKAGREPSEFPVSKRVFMAVDDNRARARTMVEDWFANAYRDPAIALESGVFGTADEVREQVEELVDVGANHLILNPVAEYAEQLEAVGEIVGLK